MTRRNLRNVAGALLFIAAAAGCSGTVYAPGYTETGFRKIANGMEAREVTELLGDPLVTYEVRCGGAHVQEVNAGGKAEVLSEEDTKERECASGAPETRAFWYTQQKDGSRGFEVRIVYFGREGKVTGTEAHRFSQ